MVDDDRSRTGRKQGQPGIVRMAGKIDKNIDPHIVDRLQDFTVVELVLAIDTAMK
ncbi:hypothetical protein BF49_6499 [Bradyrhizobium sp.]|uniref:hypothetical protein n=1 Tax=Bradyrhizobium sp. TaxID=376 RepID=UPI0007C18B5B|nr:hypothetical protein [Bradyrhizobium sp.]CUT15419.1 hypothetical protein BF49_6499 [Bradyrhizobium sp.]